MIAGTLLRPHPSRDPLTAPVPALDDPTIRALLGRRVELRRVTAAIAGIVRLDDDHRDAAGLGPHLEPALTASIAIRVRATYSS